ncbi:hypothetical protein [Hymenobacter sp. BRD67]|uniref:hypothetical protein n=1 Tax=Hymenobacter sp. BRD67 TaxID=2675877 RepID=UPI001564672D|nr:hypothetical protein [Hymenobacter sp. BRD67]QKG54382.1 hypothetical protein GKZ67_19475 [Hymenobacter sp. BRD67]
MKKPLKAPLLISSHLSQSLTEELVEKLVKRGPLLDHKVAVKNARSGLKAYNKKVRVILDVAGEAWEVLQDEQAELQEREVVLERLGFAFNPSSGDFIKALSRNLGRQLNLFQNEAGQPILTLTQGSRKYSAGYWMM